MQQYSDNFCLSHLLTVICLQSDGGNFVFSTRIYNMSESNFQFHPLPCRRMCRIRFRFPNSETVSKCRLVYRFKYILLLDDVRMGAVRDNRSSVVYRQMIVT